MKRIFAILIFSILLGGCSMNEIPEKLIPKKADEFARNYIDKLKNGDTEYCYNKLEEEFQNEEAKTIFSQSYELLKDKDLTSSRIVTSQKSTTYFDHTVTNFYNLDYEYSYSDTLWVYYSFKILEEENEFIVQGLNIQPTDQSLSNVYRFTFKNKPFINYLWLFFSVIIPIFILISLFYAIKTPMKRKWLWIIFILVGLSSFSLNWTTNEFGFQLIRFRLLGAGIVKSGIIAPWIVSFSIPVGAIIFWFKRRRILNEIEKTDNDTSAESADPS
jgi:hypothetical protein